MMEIPDEPKTALGMDKDAQTAFAKLPPSHQKEYMTWVAEAKKSETRLCRAAQSIEMLKQGNKSRYKHA